MGCEGLSKPKKAGSMLLAGGLGSLGETLNCSLVTWSVDAVWRRLDIVFRVMMKGSLRQDLHALPSTKPRLHTACVGKGQ